MLSLSLLLRRYRGLSVSLVNSVHPSARSLCVPLLADAASDLLMSAGSKGTVAFFEADGARVAVLKGRFAFSHCDVRLKISTDSLHTASAGLFSQALSLEPFTCITMDFSSATVRSQRHS